MIPRSSGRIPPGSPQAVAVADPEDRGDDEQHDFVERAGDRRDADRRKAAQPAREPAVAKEEPHRSRSSLHERHTEILQTRGQAGVASRP